VIERQLLNKVIAEQKLSLSGIVDVASAKQLGKILGVDAIVSGTITNLAQSLKVNARLISTQTGEIFAAASTEILKDDSVMSLIADETKTTVSDTDPRTSVAATKMKATKIIHQDFIFELNSCKLSAGTLTCEFKITNDGSHDAWLSLLFDSRIFDDLGNDYSASECQLGSQKDRTGVFDGVASSLVPHIVIKAALKFENINRGAARIPLLRLVFRKDQSSLSKDWVDFREVPLEK
jgi:hypothetical protein